MLIRLDRIPAAIATREKLTAEECYRVERLVNIPHKVHQPAEMHGTVCRGGAFVEVDGTGMRDGLDDIDLVERASRGAGSSVETLTRSRPSNAFRSSSLKKCGLLM